MDSNESGIHLPEQHSYHDTSSSRQHAQMSMSSLLIQTETCVPSIMQSLYTMTLTSSSAAACPLWELAFKWWKRSSTPLGRSGDGHVSSVLLAHSYGLSQAALRPVPWHFLHFRQPCSTRHHRMYQPALLPALEQLEKAKATSSHLAPADGAWLAPGLYGAEQVLTQAHSTCACAGPQQV